MKNRCYLTTASLALATLLLSACTQAPQPPPPDTRAADEKAIKDLEAQWLASAKAKDADKVMAFYADDASFMPPDMPIQNGKDAIHNVYKDLLADPNLAVDLVGTEKVEVSKTSDFAYSQGAYTMTTTDPKTKKPMMEKGKYVTVYKMQADGSWKAIEDMFNADAPAEPVKK